MKTIHLFSFLFFTFSVSLFGQNNFEKSKTDCPHVGAACNDAIHGKNNGNEILYDGNGFLGQTYNNTACGLNYVQGSVLIQQRSKPYSFNTNGTGLPTQINISGLPPSYVVDRAYLWYLASYFQLSAPNSTVTIINPASDTSHINTTRIGGDGPKCWTTLGENGTAAYRADVTSSISGNGAYSVDIGGFINGGNEVDGATLIIMYRDTTATYQGTFVIWDGIITSGNNNGFPATLSATITGLNPCANSTYANAFLIASDMQANINSGSHKDTLNNNTVKTYSNDFWNFDSSNTAVNVGQTNAYFTVTDDFDCFSLCAVGLYYQTQSCTTCPLTSSLSEINNSQPQIVVFPIPSDGSFFVELKSPARDAEVEIYDLLGKEILRKKFSGNKIEIQKVNLESGVYCLRVQADGKYLTEKLVVR